MSSCCTPDGSCHTGQAPENTTSTAVSDGHTTVYKVNGVGSAHCQGVVAKAVGGLDDVIGVEVEIGTGLVTVTTGGAPDDGLIAETVDEAGYEFAGRA
ncbi:heavy-metal-associated domain-containing protein [Streptomyces sp. HC44]|uniref:Heavy-metal-associated domain-containing protein n=1 Tax=Streptomyces scabichelini TaxID=2711217 RepID=A0A6G4UXG1_9ACTN|nr:heavy-metal-associated domain-containing protein [Streptomyces scabichelini]NGO06323.1 heavy-metal-associated domain-containing protein [Streptomyces scabichelini]